MYHKNDHDSLSKCAQPLLKARVRIWGTGATAAAQSDPVAAELFSGRKVKAPPLRPPSFRLAGQDRTMLYAIPKGES